MYFMQMNTGQFSGMLGPMRILPIVLALLFSVSASATPMGIDDPQPGTHAERSLFERIGEVSGEVGAKASELVANAMGLLGLPYRRGGISFDTGFDCSGFVRAVYEQTAGLLLPRSAAQQAAATEKIDSTELQPGDLVFFNTMRRAFSHVGIYIGDGKFVHSPKPGAKVRVDDMSASYWTRRFDGARRVPAESTPP